MHKQQVYCFYNLFRSKECLTSVTKTIFAPHERDSIDSIGFIKPPEVSESTP